MACHCTKVWLDHIWNIAYKYGIHSRLDIKLTEGAQRQATKLVQGIGNLKHAERLKKLFIYLLDSTGKKNSKKWFH